MKPYYKGNPTSQYRRGEGMSVEIQGLDRLGKLLSDITEHLPVSLDKLLDNLVFDGVMKAKEEVPVDTGELRDSIHGEREEGIGRIVAGTDHALFVEFGTGVRGRATSPVDSSFDYVYDIHNREWPGNAANPFMHRTAEFLIEDMLTRGEEMVKEIGK